MKVRPQIALVQKRVWMPTASFFRPVVLVNEFPKSGGTWLKHMIADAMGIPVWTKGSLCWGSCVMQAHWLNSAGKFRNVVLFRDLRDVMVSFYYHCFFLNEFYNANLVMQMREKFPFEDFEDISQNMDIFLKGMFNAPLFPSFTWLHFVNKWWDHPDIVRVRYEDLRRNTPAELSRIVCELTSENLTSAKAELIAEKFSMENMRLRSRELNPHFWGKQATEKSFIRSGTSGGWRDILSPETEKYIQQFAGPALERLGYSADSHSDSNN